jgi:hypothetical protein
LEKTDLKEFFKMNKRGQLGPSIGGVGKVMFALVIIVFIGIFLAILQPSIEEFRLDALENTVNSTNMYNPLIKIFLYAWNPIMWFFFIVMSIFWLVSIVNSSGGQI